MFARTVLSLACALICVASSAAIAQSAAEAGAAPPAPVTAPSFGRQLPPLVIYGKNGANLASQGSVESVTEVKENGKASGLGAIAGGVLGGVIVSKLGKLGNSGSADGAGSNTTQRILGAVGGGLLGHYLERRMRSHTRYQVAVRMDDGSLKSVTQDQKVVPGNRVVLENGVARLQAAHLDAATDLGQPLPYKGDSGKAQQHAPPLDATAPVITKPALPGIQA